MLDLQIENTQLKLVNLELQSALMQKEHDALSQKLAQLKAQKDAPTPDAPEAANG